MRGAILLYLVGLITGVLLAPAATGAILAGGVITAAIALVAGRARWWLFLATGFCWAGWHTSMYLAALPSLAAAGELRQLSGVVADFPATGEDGVRFTLKMPARTGWHASQVTVSARGAGLHPGIGDWCVLHVRLRRSHALVNPGSPDRERMLAAQRVIARAAVVPHPANLCLRIAPRYAPSRIRAHLSNAIVRAVRDPDNAAVVRALAVADRSGLSPAQRQRMRRTGTGHLLAISGLHVSLCAFVSFIFLRTLWALCRGHDQRRAAVRVAWAGAAGAAIAYATLAGFGLPAQRAACMVAVASLVALRGGHALSLDTLLIALAVLATWDPLVVLADGLWLSFAAVAILLLMAAVGDRSRPRIFQIWRLHLWLALGLAPLTAMLFGDTPLIAPLANFMAVPWASTVVVPLVLIATVASGFSPGVAALLWSVSGELWSWLDALLAMLIAMTPQMHLLAGLTPGSAWLLGLGAALMSLPRACGLRTAAIVLLVAALTARPRLLPRGALEVTVFDVGQGTSVLVRSRDHALLYDTGPRWHGAQHNPAGRAVIPALRRRGVNTLDAVVISHADSDHAGGLHDILQGQDVARVYAAPGSQLGRPFTPCIRGERWHWPGVQLRWLHPPAKLRASRNDLSCVLAIETDYGRLLLPGDIEAASEHRLLSRDARDLAADVLLVPHHGSKTSSGTQFVAAVGARYALVSAGYGNRYGLPHTAVTKAYTDAGALVANTATSGALTVMLDARGIRLSSERSRRRGFWVQAALEGDSGSR